MSRDFLRGISAPFPCISFCRELTTTFWHQCNVKGSIDICMVNVPAAWALKSLAVPVACMSAAATFLACRIRINIDYLYSPQLGFIFDKLL